MELKPNNPVIVLIALLAIAGAIAYLQSMKAAPLSYGGQPAGSSNGVLQPANAAPELRGIAGYINTPPNLTLASLRGKVVVVDFWTYSCINCIRTLPYLETWYEKYRDDGLVIIGVHTPEFDFEKDYSNVQKAVEKYGITYPVVQDNDYATWNAYGNRFWPHKYLVDANGVLRFDHIGEGGYEETESEVSLQE